MSRPGVCAPGHHTWTFVRKVLLFAMLLVLASSIQMAPALADSASVCGVLREFRAPTPTLPGTVTVGSDQFAISPTAKQNVGAGAATVGANVCLTGTWVASETVGRNLTDFTIVVQTGPPSQNTASTSTPSSDPTAVVIFVIGAGVLLALALIISRRRAR